MWPHVVTTDKVGVIITCLLQIREISVIQVKHLPSITQLATSRAGVQTQIQPSPKPQILTIRINIACSNNRKDSVIGAEQRVVGNRNVSRPAPHQVGPLMHRRINSNSEYGGKPTGTLRRKRSEERPYSYSLQRVLLLIRSLVHLQNEHLLRTCYMQDTVKLVGVQ